MQLTKPCYSLPLPGTAIEGVSPAPSACILAGVQTKQGTCLSWRRPCRTKALRAHDPLILPHLHRLQHESCVCGWDVHETEGCARTLLQGDMCACDVRGAGL